MKHRTQNTAGNSDVIFFIDKWMPLIFLFYFIVVFSVRIALPDSLEFDESEQVLTTQWLAAGYGTQPPLYNWLQQLAFAIFGVSIATLAAFKDLLLISIYLSYWYASKTILKRKDAAIISTLGLLTIPQIVFESQRDLTHTVIVIFSASLFLWALFATLTRPTLIAYMALGATTAFGILSKYNFALLPAASFFAVVLDQEGRKRIFDRRLFITITVFILFTLPHFYWLIDNFKTASQNTVTKMRGNDNQFWLLHFGNGLFALAMATIGFAGATFVIYLGVFGRDLINSFRSRNRWTTFCERFFLALLGCMLVMIVIIGAGNIKDRWLTPLLLIVPLYLSIKLEVADRIKDIAFKRMLHVSFAIMLIVPVILYCRVETARWTGIYQKLNFPYHALIDNILRETGATPSLIIADNTWIGGNLRLHLQDVPVFSPQFPQFEPQFKWTQKQPIIAVWQTRNSIQEELPPSISGSFQRFAGNDAKVEIHSIQLPYNKGREGDLIQFSYAVAYPSNVMQ